MKHAVRNRGVQGDRIHHYVGDVVQDLQERNVFDVRIPHAHISTPCNALLTWGFYCTTSPTLQRCVPTSGENTGAKQGGSCPSMYVMRDIIITATPWEVAVICFGR